MAEADGNGVVLPVSQVNAAIMASSELYPSVSCSCAVSVLASVESLILDANSLTLKMGEKRTLSAKVCSVPDSPDFKRVAFASDNPSVAKVDDYGKNIRFSWRSENRRHIFFG